MRSYPISLLLLGAACVHQPQSPTLARSLDNSQLLGPSEATVDIWRTSEDGSKIYVIAETPDGVARVFMVDTGASVSVISDAVAEDLGIDTEKAPGEIVGLGGSSRWFRGTIDSLDIGEFRLHDVDVAVGVPGLPSHAGAVPLAGILGNNIWQEFGLRLDYLANEMTLARPGTMLRPKTAETLLFNGQHAMTSVEVSFSVDQELYREPLVLEIDTGAHAMVISGSAPETLANAATEGLEPLLGIGAGDNLPPSNFLRTTRRIALESIRVGGHTIERDVEATWINYDEGRDSLGPAGLPGLLGHQALDGHVLSMDYQAGWVSVSSPDSTADIHNIHRWALDRDGCTSPRTCATEPQLAVEQARHLFWLGEDDDAIQLLEQMWTANPDSPVAGVYYGRLLRQQGDIDASMALMESLPLETIIEQYELVAITNSLVLAGQPAAAGDLVREAALLAPENASVWIALSDVLRSEGDLSGARRALSEANRIEENPDGHLLRRAWVAHLDGDFHGALTHVRRLMQIYPNGGVAPWFYAMMVANTTEEALFFTDIEHARDRLHPGDGPLDFFAAAYRRLEHNDEAAELMEAGRTRDCEASSDIDNQSNCEAWYRALAGLDLEQAQALIDSAIANQPNRAEFLDTLAVVHEAMGEFREASEAAHSAAIRVPDDVYLLWQAHRLYMAANTGQGG